MAAPPLYCRHLPALFITPLLRPAQLQVQCRALPRLLCGGPPLALPPPPLRPLLVAGQAEPQAAVGPALVPGVLRDPLVLQRHPRHQHALRRAPQEALSAGKLLGSVPNHLVLPH